MDDPLPLSMTESSKFIRIFSPWLEFPIRRKYGELSGREPQDAGSIGHTSKHTGYGALGLNLQQTIRRNKQLLAASLRIRYPKP
jgi:hypothetical protein